VLSLLSGCGHLSQPSKEIYSENELYKMYTEDGKWYIEFNQATDGEDSYVLTTNLVGITYPEFDSAADLANMLKSGNIRDDCIRHLKRISDKNVIEIFDPNKICDLKTPNSLIYENVDWVSKVYKFSIKAENFHGYVECYDFDQEQYIRKFEEFRNFPNENQTVTGETTMEDRNAKVVFSNTLACDLKNILYKIASGESEIYVNEKYVLRYFDESAHLLDAVSETVPKSIEIFGSDGTHYWRGWFKGFKERPSVEWLSSFGLTPIK
jgi:hypothetical protein